MSNKTPLALLLASAALFMNCWASTYDEYDDMSDFPWFLLYYRASYPSGNEVILEDRGDGTIVVTKRSLSGYRYYRVVVKKCPQGSLYNGADHTCVIGEGPQTFQYCSANSNACNNSDGTLNNQPTSAAYATCASDTTQSLTWMVIKADVLADIMLHPDRGTVFPGLSAGNWYWGNQTTMTDRATVYRDGAFKENRLKTESHGVLCQHDGVYL